MRLRMPEPPWPTLAVLAMLLLAIVVVVATSGCSRDDGDGPVPQADSGRLYEAHPRLADGRTVTCLIYSPMASKGGLSCDWQGATR